LISLNVGSIVENKLNRQQNIIVKIQKSSDSEEYNVFVDQTQLSNPENFTNANFVGNNNFGTSQNLPNVSTNNVAQNNVQVVAPVSSQPTLSNVSITQQPVQPPFPTTSESVQFPNIDSKPSCNGDIKNLVNNNMGNPPANEPKTVCKNASLDQQRIDAYKYLIQNGNKVGQTNLVNSCDVDHTDPDNITNSYGWDDISQIYRRNEFYGRTYLEDPILRGGNIDNYNDYAKLTDIGLIPLNKDVPNPRPNDYIFSTSSVFEQ